MTKCAFSSSSISDFPPTSFGTPVWFRGTKEILGSDLRILDERRTLFSLRSTEIEHREEKQIHLNSLPSLSGSKIPQRKYPHALPILHGRWVAMRYRAMFITIC